MNTVARVDTYRTAQDAAQAKAYLQACDIDVRLEGDSIDEVGFTSGPILGDVGLYVNEQDEEQARQLLATYHANLLKRRMEQRESPDHLVTRSCIAAYLGFITIPIVLHLYSLWLLLQVDRNELSRAKRYRYLLSVTGNAVAFGLLGIWVLSRLLG